MKNLLIWLITHAIVLLCDATIDNVTCFNRGGDWNTGGTCHLETMPDLSSFPVSSQTSVHLKIVMDVLSERLDNSKMKKLDLLNVTYLTSLRKDGHSSLYYLGPGIGPPPLHRQDCSHWCLPGVPDSWNELLYTLFLKWEYSRTRKSMNASHAPVWWIRKLSDLTTVWSSTFWITLKLTPPITLLLEMGFWVNWLKELPLCYRRHDYQTWSESWVWLFSGQFISSSSKDFLVSRVRTCEMMALAFCTMLIQAALMLYSQGWWRNFWHATFTIETGCLRLILHLSWLGLMWTWEFTREKNVFVVHLGE